jgi:hypothetical protein
MSKNLGAYGNVGVLGVQFCCKNVKKILVSKLIIFSTI